MKIYITKHARDRAFERFGWHYWQLKDQAVKSLTEGSYVMYEEVLRDLFEKSCIARETLPYLLDGVVFIFKENVLITVYSITGRGTYCQGTSL